MRCFVIDDHPGIVQMHAQIVSNLDLGTPEMYTDAREALAALETCTDDSLVLLDLSMPELDGDEILARLDHLESAKTFHVVIVSGVLADIPDFVSELKHVQVEAVLPKPMRPEQLEDVVRRLPRH